MSAPKSKAPIVELSVPPQIFVDDLCRIDFIGGMVHLIFASTRREATNANAELERVVEVRMIMPPDSVQVIARAMRAGRIEPDRQIDDGDNAVSLH